MKGWLEVPLGGPVAGAGVGLRRGAAIAIGREEEDGPRRAAASGQSSAAPRHGISSSEVLELVKESDLRPWTRKPDTGGP